MKKTIQGFIVCMIDKYLAKCQLAMAVCEVELAGVFTYSLLWLGLPLIACVCLLEAHHYILALLCLSTMFINWQIYSDDEFFANKKFESLRQKRNKLAYIIDSECRFRYLLKKSLKQKLDSSEYNELRESLQKMSVDIGSIPDIKTDFILCSEDKITNEV